MSRSFKSLAAIFAMAIMATGCTNTPNDSSDGSSSSSSQISSPNSSSTEVHVEPETAPVSSKDILSQTATCTVEFSDSGITTEGKGAFASADTLTITTAGVYCLSGTSSNAKIIVEADKTDKVTLVLNGVSLTSKKGAVIDCEEAGELVICTAKGTENVLSDTKNYTFAGEETEPDAAVFCRSDLTLSGEGKLTVNALYNDAIKCKDNLQIINGTYAVKSEGDGIVGKDSVKIYDGDFSVESGKDGIKSSKDNDEKLGFVTINKGNFKINSARDGIQAETKLTIFGGNIEIVSGGDAAYDEVKPDTGNPGDRPFDRDWNKGGLAVTAQSTENTESLKGLKAGGDIVVYNTETVVNITSADDAIHSNANVSIFGGEYTLSSCDDGIHAGELLTINSGTIKITKSYEGLEGMNIAINGGVIDLKATDDGINVAGGDNGDFFGFGSGTDDYYITISGGDITVNADGDGVDSNGTIAMSGGKLVIYGPTNSGNGAIDYQKSFAMSGGELIALGAMGMAQAPSTLSQPCLSISANVNANAKIEVKSDNGTVIMSTTTPKACQSLIFSSPNFKAGSSYSIYADNTLLSTVTAENGVSGNGANGAGGMGGGNKPGGMGGNKPGKNPGDIPAGMNPGTI